MKRHDNPRVVSLSYWSMDDKWRQAFRKTLAICAAEDIDPEMFFKSVADTAGYFCALKSIKMQPGHVSGPKAFTRYAAWLVRQRQRKHGALRSTDTRRTDKLLDQHKVYVAVYLTKWKPRKEKGVDFGLYTQACNASGLKVTDINDDRLVIALCSYLHSLHSSLPDVLYASAKSHKFAHLPEIARVVRLLTRG